MVVENTFITGLKLIHLNKYLDDRGSFMKVFDADFFEENGLETKFKESYFSISNKNVIRGMHLQIPPVEHTKLVYVNQGKLLDVILDVRKDSPYFGKYFTVELDTRNPLVVYIPVGCAHGFLSLEDQTMMTYLQTTCYNPIYDTGISYNSFGMNWGIGNPIISARDKGFLSLKKFENPF